MTEEVRAVVPVAARAGGCRTAHSFHAQATGSVKVKARRAHRINSVVRDCAGRSSANTSAIAVSVPASAHGQKASFLRGRLGHVKAEKEEHESKAAESYSPHSVFSFLNREEIAA